MGQEDIVRIVENLNVPASQRRGMNNEKWVKVHKAIEKLLGPKQFLLRCDICGEEYIVDSYEELSFADVQRNCRRCNNPTVFLAGRLIHIEDSVEE